MHGCLLIPTVPLPARPMRRHANLPNDRFRRACGRSALGAPMARQRRFRPFAAAAGEGSDRPGCDIQLERAPAAGAHTLSRFVDWRTCQYHRNLHLSIRDVPVIRAKIRPEPGREPLSPPGGLSRRENADCASRTRWWREMDSNFRFPDAPSGRSAEARTFCSDREFAPLAWRDRDFEPPAPSRVDLCVRTRTVSGT
jgi:hypothetical protein